MRDRPAGAWRRLMTVGLGAVLVSCGLPTPNAPSTASRADAILKESAAQLERVRSYHAIGMVTAGYGIDLAIVRGVGLRGQLVYKGLRWDTIVVGSDVYFRGVALWRATQPPPTASALADQWVLMRRGVGYYGLVELLPRLDTAIATQIFAQHHPIDRIASASLTGRPTLHLSGPGDTYDVSDDGGPRLPLHWTDLREPPVDGELCGLTLDQFNGASAIGRPPAVPYSGMSEVLGTTPPAVG